MTVVLVDGYALSDGSQLRGVGTYIKRIASGLRAETGLSLHLLVDPAAEVGEHDTVELRHRLPPRLRGREHDLRLYRALVRAKPDVFLSPAQHPPRRSPVPWVQTLHDVIPLTRPDPLLERDRRRWLRIAPRVRRAAAVVTVSRFSADEGIRHLALDPGRVHVIHQGVDLTHFTPAPGAGPATSGDCVPYLLVVAAWGPHKGFAEALRVIAKVADAGFPHRLLLAGPQDDWMRSRLNELIASSPRPERVVLTGYVDDLPALYRGATAQLVTSRCEGFGLPALEAMACGTPVVAFDNSSLPEVVGDAGVLVRDGDVDAMAGELCALIRGGDGARRELAARGIARAAGFGWEHSVAAHAELLRSVAA